MKSDEKTDYICLKCGELVWLTQGDGGREYACECYSFPLYMLEFNDLPKFWFRVEEKEDKKEDTRERKNDIGL